MAFDWFRQFWTVLDRKNGLNLVLDTVRPKLNHAWKTKLCETFYYLQIGYIIIIFITLWSSNAKLLRYLPHEVYSFDQTSVV